MYLTTFCIGKSKIRIYTDPFCVGEPAALIGEEETALSEDFDCFIRPIGEYTDSLPAFMRLSNGRQYEGIYKNTFYTLMPGYGLMAETDLAGRTVQLYLKQGLLCQKSYYLIRSVIRQHILRLIFQMKDAPIHAASVYLPLTQSGMIITGASGSGKSSMLWHILQATKAVLVSDDISVVSHLDGQVSGDGGPLHVCPDFAVRYSLSPSAYRTVSPGRKLEVAISSRQQMQIIPRHLCIMRKSEAPDLQRLTREEAKEQLLQLHQQWYFSQTEHDIGMENLEKLFAHIECAFFCSLNANFMKTVQSVVNMLTPDVTTKGDAHMPQQSVV